MSPPLQPGMTTPDLAPDSLPHQILAILRRAGDPGMMYREMALAAHREAERLYHHFVLERGQYRDSDKTFTWAKPSPLPLMPPSPFFQSNTALQSPSVHSLAISIVSTGSRRRQRVLPTSHDTFSGGNFDDVYAALGTFSKEELASMDVDDKEESDRMDVDGHEATDRINDLLDAVSVIQLISEYEEVVRTAPSLGIELFNQKFKSFSKIAAVDQAVEGFLKKARSIVMAVGYGPSFSVYPTLKDLLASSGEAITVTWEEQNALAAAIRGSGEMPKPENDSVPQFSGDRQATILFLALTSKQHIGNAEQGSARKLIQRFALMRLWPGLFDVKRDPNGQLATHQTTTYGEALINKRGDLGPLWYLLQQHIYIFYFARRGSPGQRVAEITRWSPHIWNKLSLKDGERYFHNLFPRNAFISAAHHTRLAIIELKENTKGVPANTVFDKAILDQATWMVSHQSNYHHDLTNDWAPPRMAAEFDALLTTLMTTMIGLT
ncbi:hypothetical protein Hypma_013707 [Hypsizygus marmoreus]|uniref:Uncharacterized protein n=1 Tax=Hypsizygus marmoreus TaxID=39966 RepID=A0A369JFS2_HYPMA|nr:hypothetical protein Hypma_013707 [Hypsizygus marmoreus]